ncbi:nucleoporin NUP35-like [Haliotis asinina]|uniref:nucleoporin NUP35-like n=1 Tax=Haliotis asinina TaxID=109174 RepID=UPI003531CC37
MFSASADLHEPMLASPSSPGTHQYLPGYLLGDSVQHGISPAGPRLWSTGGHSPQKNPSFTSPPGGATSGTPRDLSRTKDKGGAPPVKSLFLSPGADVSYSTPGSQSFTSQVPSRTTATPASRGVSPGPPTSGLFPGATTPKPTGESFIIPPSKIPTSPAQMDPFYTQGDSLKAEDILDETWVTVFGFPPAATSFIVQQFSQYGNIMKHVSSMEGNWMHIHYQSKIQAKKALSKNGKVFGNSMMVGVLPCIDKNVMDDNKENDDTMATPTLNMSRLADTSTSSKHTPIRPLTSAYQASRTDYEVLKGNQLPQKDNSFISKVKEYMLGW